MTALTMPTRPGHDARVRPVPWRRMAWVTWRQHRAALAGVAVFLGALAVYLWLTGLQMHHAEAASCHPAGSLGCAINFTGRYGETAIMVSIALQAVPALIGAFIGAPVLARELETGTFRYAWTQGIGRLRWTVGKLVPLAVAVTAVAGAFTVLFAWYNQPWVAAGYVTPFSARVFDLLGVAFAAWTLAAFAIGVLAGMLIRRAVPAIAATLAAYAGLAFTTRAVAARALHHTAGHQQPEPARLGVGHQRVVHQGRHVRVRRPWQRDSRHRQAALRWPLLRDALARAAPRPARLHALDQLPAWQPVLALPVDRGRLAARAVRAAHRRDRLAGPPPGRVTAQRARRRSPRQPRLPCLPAATRPVTGAMAAVDGYGPVRSPRS
ncbi:MAG: ABC transporter permease subunit [Streptosporangiales bacterium]